MSAQVARPLSPPPEDPPPAVLTASDGATAAVEDGAIELRDRGGKLLVRYAEGCAEVRAPRGDLTLAAPGGRVVVQAATDIALQAARDLTHEAGRTLSARTATVDLTLDLKQARLTAPELEVRTRRSRLVAEQAAVVARTVSTTAQHLAQQAEHYELRATKLVESVRDSFRDASGLAQARYGRAKTIVRDVFSLRSRRSVIVSEQDTTIDGERILLG